MAISFAAVLATPWSTLSGTTATSPSFTPATADTILVWNGNFNASTLSTSGTSGSYSIITPPGQWPDAEGDGYALASQLSATAVSQTITVTSGTATDQIGHWIRYSGVGSITTVPTGGNNTATPGSGLGAILGLPVTVPVGSVLVAWCSAEDAVEVLAVAGSGTQRNSANDANSVITLCVADWAGAGASITPSFTAATGLHNYTVLQVILTPPAAVNTNLGFIRQPGPGIGPFSNNQFKYRPTAFFVGATNVTVALTGQSASFVAGNVTHSLSVTLTGASVASAPGTVAPSTVVGVNGQSMGSSQGSPTVPGGASISGQSAAFTAGTLIPSILINALGSSAVYAQGALSPSLSVALLGQSATFSQAVIISSGGTPVGGNTVPTVGFISNTGTLKNRQ